MKGIIKYFTLAFYVISKEKEQKKLTSIFLLAFFIFALLFFEYQFTGYINPFKKLYSFGSGKPLDTELIIFLCVFFYVFLNIIYVVHVIFNEDPVTESPKGTEVKPEINSNGQREVTKISTEVIKKDEDKEPTNTGTIFDGSKLGVLFGKSLFSDGEKEKSKKADKFDSEMEDILQRKLFNKL